MTPIELIAKTITLDTPPQIKASIDRDRSTDHTVIVSLDNQYNHPITLSITVNDDGLVTTSIGIMFSNAAALCECFWSINWFRFSTSANDVTPLI